MMDAHCEGALLVPPDRGTIIGRALWKPRYVVFGKQGRQEPTLSRPTTTSRVPSGRKSAKAPSSKPSIDDLVQGATDQLWLSVYKSKDDMELIGQHAMSSIKSCEIQSIQYRKPGPTIPTLVITFEPDAASDKARKRRSSRTGGLTSSSSHSNSLLFRTIPEERYNIYDWQILIQPRLKPNSNFDMPLSPDSPAFTTFINPFTPRSPIQERSPMSPRPEPYRRSSNATYTSTQSVQTRERSQTSTLISPSPSLRSKSSNISSQASSFGRPQGYQNMLPIQQLPADLPSPASTTGFDDQSILGWTSAQGRSSALSSHTRGSNSMSTTGTPPAPRETILDRAFQLKYIPGSDRIPGGEEDSGKLSSIARFEALMKEAEKAKSKPNTSEPTSRKGSVPGWNLDEEDEDDEVDSDMEEPVRFSTRGDSDDVEMEDDDVDPMALSIHEMPTPAQRALEYISGRSTPLAVTTRRPMSPPTRNVAPAELPRSKTTPPRVRTKERPKSLFYQSSSSSHKHKKSDESHHSKNTSSSTMKRRSSNSTKRLSFTEFTQRLSSTSSLLLVQTNASSSSGGVASSRNSRQSSEASFTDEPDDGILLHRGLSQSRLSGMGGVVNRPPLPEIDTSRCGGWRGSGLGVLGGEGGFL